MGFVEQNVTIDAKYALGGTLTFLEEQSSKHPVIIMVHGSGPVDRDSNAKRMPMNIFKELSALAVDEGFATLRYDKRGLGASGGDYHATGVYDLVDDVQAVVNFAKEHEEIDNKRIILLGHSEGTILTPLMNDRDPVAGLILLAPCAEKLAETTKWQREEMVNEIRSMKGFQGWLLKVLKVDQKILKMNDQLTEKILGTDEAVITYKGKKVNAKWNREHADVDVSESLINVTCPVLAISGTKDVNVKMDDAKKVCTLVKGECESHLLKDLTHILRKTETEYLLSKILNGNKKLMKKPLDGEVKDIIRQWLGKFQ
ncbi:alpha/beta hydrolase [Rossellomorea aquimaris]|uniref:alpha/beta hydrolase family protein n=1 Tax=Rossellomorea aquimaris TaxID=189382 RepID=UPI001CD26129|nr:alpha/beta fold hydrolase [Rossellomorea aquimaris]MCA1055694.1 alpha/beta hydrolase [Rossellomorea aquimaris]